MTSKHLRTSPATPARAVEENLDWARLGSYVLDRRVELGHRQRSEFALALGISLRTVGDIETGRRGRYDPRTIATLENTLGWTTGSVERIVRGGEPVLRSEADHVDPVLRRILLSNISDEHKSRIMQLLAEEQRRAERRRAEYAAELLRFVESGESAEP